jgi:polysaccharide export outer membrane protein
MQVTRYAQIIIAGVWLLLAAAVIHGQNAPPANYVAGPQDRLRITVWNQADISGEYTIAGDGTFTFPLIGPVRAGGLTLAQLEASLKARLASGFYKDPQVTIAVLDYRSQRVFVVGELRTPGSYPLTGPTSLVEVLATAGSTTSAAADHAFIIHSNGANGPVLPGQPQAAEVVRVDLRQLGDGLSATATVADGDTVYVPRAATAFVFGQVRSPGAYPIGQDTTVLQALSLAGGVTEFGAAGRIRVVRIVAGEERQFKVKLSDPVRAGDTVVVPERFF